MSITVRLWTKKDLQDIKENKDPFKTTIFLNVSTFSQEEIQVYPYHLRKRYFAYLGGQSEVIRFYATDDKNALKFLKAEYNLTDYPLVELTEIITTHRRQ